MMEQIIESEYGESFRLRIAEVRDAEPIVSVINIAFRKAEGFLLDRDRIALQTVQELLQKGTFLVAEDRFRAAQDEHGALLEDIDGRRFQLDIRAGAALHKLV